MEIFYSFRFSSFKNMSDVLGYTYGAVVIAGGVAGYLKGTTILDTFVFFFSKLDVKYK